MTLKNNMDIFKLTIKDIRAGLSNGDFKCVDLVKAYLENIKLKNESINALVRISDTALDEAREIDRRIADNEDVGVFAWQDMTKPKLLALMNSDEGEENKSSSNTEVHA